MAQALTQPIPFPQTHPHLPGPQWQAQAHPQRWLGRPDIVLVVEDEPDNITLMQALLDRRPGCRLVVAHGRHAALHLAQPVQPALLVVDVDLPQCQGDELLRRLRRVPGCAGVPAIAMTADASFDAAGCGFVGAWPKPLHPARLAGDIDRYLGPANAPLTRR
ncbi:MAG: response regulator [Rubrivivax sp.]|nr:response regulator [Rubrivivax sp.]